MSGTHFLLYVTELMRDGSESWQSLHPNLEAVLHEIHTGYRNRLTNYVFRLFRISLDDEIILEEHKVEIPQPSKFEIRYKVKEN